MNVSPILLVTNTLNTPVEALEYAYPLPCAEYSIRRGSGGAGRHMGGDGLVRAFTLLAPGDGPRIATPGGGGYGEPEGGG